MSRPCEAAGKSQGRAPPSLVGPSWTDLDPTVLTRINRVSTSAWHISLIYSFEFISPSGHTHYM
jgi:hypothetical protein